MIHTGNYTCLEILAKQTDGKQGWVKLKSGQGEESRQGEEVSYEAGRTYYKWLKIPVKQEVSYELTCENAHISLAYLSGCSDILEKGIRFVEPENGGRVLEPEEAAEYYNTPYREQYHFAPWKNWMNDPNGLCWYKGYYHLFYQYNPHGQEWSNMYWGHGASRDMVHWTHLPIVLEPKKEVLDKADVLKGGAFSGSAVPLEDEVVFYLTRHAGPMEDCEETIQQQWMTRSRDMLEFEPEKLIIKEPPRGGTFDFRDPKVIQINGSWYMVLASAMGKKAAILLYKSEDMEHWDYIGPLLTEEEEGVRCFECPDFFPLDNEYVAWGALMCHRDTYGRIQMSRYYIGDFQEDAFSVKAEGWFDFGSNCYAMQSFEHEGRRIVISWISDFCGEHVAVEKGAYGSMTIPRELHVKNHKLYMNPAEEIYSLKGKTIYEGNRENVCLENIQGNSYYARITFSEKIEFTVLLGKDEEKEIRFVSQEGYTGIRTKGVKSESLAFPADVSEVKEMEIFVDRRVVEIYLNRGEAAGTKLFYNSCKDGCFHLQTEQPEGISRAEIAEMSTIWK